ncbi:uncharacterized protein LOC116307791 isoform X3 [Actinia tenebrosa]|uniref:Uncharacterized protein LOC116307791 isoform X3 n=1 Tax=Actinia tenebrosa TaxID=6105 RepID=A0A6P8JAY3_ACTTE|nr:uncharacterized protein LOC116307791 isoform X3 [Actinia tenebrosa]
MASQEERDNYFSLTLLLFRVGNQRLREYFKTQWPIVYQRVRPGTVPPPWQDTPHDAAEMKKIQPSKLKFKFKDEETKFNSGNTNDWDFSLLTSVLRYSSLQFVLPSSPESKALDDLKKICNELIGHAADAAITNADFNTAWTDACNALALFNASADDFKCVQDDVKKPLDVLYPMLKQCVEQEKEVKDSVDTMINRIEKLQQTVEQQHTTLQQTVEQQHTTLQQTVEQQHETLQQVEVQHTALQQTVEKQHETHLEAARNIERKVDLVLSQGQQGQKRSSADVQPEEDVKTEKPRTTINNREGSC